MIILITPTHTKVGNDESHFRFHIEDHDVHTFNVLFLLSILYMYLKFLIDIMHVEIGQMRLFIMCVFLLNSIKGSVVKHTIIHLEFLKYFLFLLSPISVCMLNHPYSFGYQLLCVLHITIGPYLVQSCF